MDTPKLSDLMLIGAGKFPGCVGDYVRYEADGPHVCALGAAYVGLTGELPHPVHNSAGRDDNLAALHRAGVLIGQHLEAPDDLMMGVPDEPKPLTYIITRLNDDYGWTREQIAAWLAENGL